MSGVCAGGGVVVEAGGMSGDEVLKKLQANAPGQGIHQKVVEEILYRFSDSSRADSDGEAGRP